MAYFLQQLINGLTLGSIYGLIAIGYTMVYGIIGMINFAHGEIYMIGAFISIIALLVLGLAGVSYVPLALALVLLTTMFFTSLEDLSSGIDDPALDVAPDDFLVLQNAGPLSASGMPEAGYLPIPGKLARAGVKDMVRISDARMSGTAYGSIVLHVTPDATSGGPLSKVRNCDRIR